MCGDSWLAHCEANPGTASPVCSPPFTTTSCGLCPVFREPRAEDTICVRPSWLVVEGWCGRQSVGHAGSQQRRWSTNLKMRIPVSQLHPSWLLVHNLRPRIEHSLLRSHSSDLNGNRGQHWLMLYLLCSRLRSRHCFHKIISSHKPSRMQSHSFSNGKKSAKQKNEGNCPRLDNKRLEKLGWELRLQGQTQTQSQDSGQGPLLGSPAEAPSSH